MRRLTMIVIPGLVVAASVAAAGGGREGQPAVPAQRAGQAATDRPVTAATPQKPNRATGVPDAVDLPRHELIFAHRADATRTGDDIGRMRPDGTRRQVLNTAPNTEGWQKWRPGAHYCRRLEDPHADKRWS